MICSSVETWAWPPNVTLSGCNILMRRARANLDKLIYLIKDATRRWGYSFLRIFLAAGPESALLVMLVECYSHFPSSVGMRE